MRRKSTPVTEAQVAEATSAHAPPPKPENKLQILSRLLTREGGAQLAEMMAATGWQAHSVRGALAGALRNRGLAIESLKVDGARVYRVQSPVGQ
jgi:hypothetical protein